MARFKRSYARRKVYKKPRRPSLNPVKRYISKRRTFKYGNLYRDVKMLKGLINTEIKYLDAYMQNNATENYYQLKAGSTKATEGNATVEGSQGYFSMPVHYPGQGDDFNQREGRSIKLKSVQWKGTMALDVDNNTSEQGFSRKCGRYRLMIIVDHQAQTGEITDPVPILFQPDQNGDYSLNSRVNRQQNKRYTILVSKNLYLNYINGKRDVNLYYKLSDKIKFNGTTSLDFMDKMFHCVILPAANFDVNGEGDYLTQANSQFETRITYVDN